MKRIHGESVVAEAIAHYDTPEESVPSKSFYKHHYPIKYREAMMRAALHKLRLDEDRALKIEQLLTDKTMSLQMKFHAFIDIIADEDLASLGW